MRVALIVIAVVVAVIAILVALLLIESRIELNKIRLTEYIYKGPKVDKALDNKSFIFLSDFHEAEEGRLNERIITFVKEAAPSLILIGGDMINGSHEEEDITPSTSLINALSEIAPIYMASGNHEMKVREGYYGYKSLWERFYGAICDKVEYIDNRSVYPKELPIKLSGLDLDYLYYKRFSDIKLTGSTVTEHIGECDKTAFNILLAHNPEYFDGYSQWGADIVLSGHYHGGILRLPLLGGVVSPKLKLFPKYEYGMYKKGDTVLYVTNGIGQHTLKLRLNNIPEVVKITFKSENR